MSGGIKIAWEEICECHATAPVAASSPNSATAEDQDFPSTFTRQGYSPAIAVAAMAANMAGQTQAGRITLLRKSPSILQFIMTFGPVAGSPFVYPSQSCIIATKPVAPTNA